MSTNSLVASLIPNNSAALIASFSTNILEQICTPSRRKDKPSIIKPNHLLLILVPVSHLAATSATFRPSFVPLVIASTDHMTSSLFLMLGVISVDGYIIQKYKRIEAVRKCWTTLMLSDS